MFPLVQCSAAIQTHCMFKTPNGILNEAAKTNLPEKKPYNPTHNGNFVKEHLHRWPKTTVIKTSMRLNLVIGRSISKIFQQIIQVQKLTQREQCNHIIPRLYQLLATEQKEKRAQE